MQISAGKHHTCAVLATGRVWCWGSNWSGQLGHGSIGGIQIVPVEVALPPRQALQVSAGANHTCAVPDGAALNITVVNQANDEIGFGDGFLRAWPCDHPKPNTSVLHYRLGEIVPNAVNIAPAADGSICLESSTPVDLIVDQVGAWSGAEGFEGKTPERLLDTRDLGAATTTAVVAGFDVDKATFINVTAVNAPSDGFVTVGPAMNKSRRARI